MELKVVNMNEQYAVQILNWKYEPPYNFYNNEYTKEALEELVDSSYYALLDKENELFGYFCTGESAQVHAGHATLAYKENFVDMGLGMNPSFVGKGNGVAFCSFIINVIQKENGEKPIRLTVANFNKRAIHVYEKLGFKKEKEFRTGLAKFMTMIRGVN